MIDATEHLPPQANDLEASAAAPWRALIQPYLADDDFPGAEEVLRRYLEANPGDTKARIALAHYVSSQPGRYADSLEELRRAGEIIGTKNPPEILVATGWIALRQGDFQGLEDVVETLQVVARRDPNSHLLAAALALESDDLPGAAVSIQRVLEQDPDNPDAWASLARCEVANHQIEEARSSTQRALELDPHHPVAHGLRALDLALRKRYPDAHRHALSSLRRQPTNRDAHTALVLMEGEWRWLLAPYWAMRRLMRRLLPNLHHGFLYAVPVLVSYLAYDLWRVVGWQATVALIAGSLVIGNYYPLCNRGLDYLVTKRIAAMAEPN
ncbi:MAG: tetratricopeptide repeat protein [Acidobacteriota bacterium]